jgi:hypothetical protein
LLWWFSFTNRKCQAASFYRNRRHMNVDLLIIQNKANKYQEKQNQTKQKVLRVRGINQ